MSLVGPDDLKILGEVLVLTVVGGYAAVKARRAERQTRETGNGFAKDVKQRLNRIEGKVDGVEEKVDAHVAAHADSDVRRGRWRR